MINNNSEKVSSGRAEEDAQADKAREQIEQQSVDFNTNACAAPPDEAEQVSSPQAEPPSAVSSDSPNDAVETSASDNTLTNTQPTITNTMSTNNDIPTVPADDESAATQMNNTTAADVESATGSSTTNNTAAALASANLNSGTDCATTPDTTMNIDTNTNEGIALASTEARSTDPNAPRSESNSWFITVPECDSATISVVLGADDLGSVSVGPISLELGPRGQYGGGTYTEVSDSASINPGTYKVSTTYSNITLPPEIPNIARFRCDITLNVDGEEIVPEPIEITPVDNEDEGEDETCPQTCDIQNPQPDCGCDKDENGAGDNGEPDSGAGCGGNAGASDGGASAVAMMADAEGEATTVTSSSGAGRKMTVRGGLQDMLWRMNFATFRGMAGIPDGALEIRARAFTSDLCTPAALSFKHPFDTQVLASGGTSENPLNGAFQIRNGSSRVNYFCFADGLVSPLAGSAKRGGKGNMLSTTNAARNTVTRSLSLQDKRGGFARYDADDNGNMGMLSAYTTKSGRTYESADISSTLQVIRDDDGAIAQLWNAWDGLMVIDSVTETGYRMAFYLPHQVGAQDASTKLFAASGSPWRTVVVAGDVANATLQMTDTVLTREPQISRFICGADGAWSTEQGSGTAKICRHVARELVEQEDEDAPEQYRLVTTLHRGDLHSPDECVAEIWQTGATGHLCISRTLGYGSPGALTTLYEYDSEGRRIKEISPSGSVSSFTYDDCGREMVRMTPYHGNHTLAVYTYYRESGSADPDISYRRAVLNETATQIWREDFTYEEQDGYRRVTKSTQALGCIEPRVEITETWLDIADEPLCRGRLRMRQGVDGIQTWYSYEANSDFGAVYKVTAETRANGEAVPAHSRRDVTYISAVGNNMRHEVYRLLSNGTWALTESENYEYDSENNWVKRTRGNGRVTTRAMMCCGPLSVTDEDGVTTTYGYNAAHQLEEVIREEILEDGVVITPETITTYTRDAAGHVLSERKDIGAMTSIETSEYDLMGRLIREVDELGRVTTTVYSLDGLTETITEPSGAMFITSKNADGTIARRAGNGQRELIYSYDFSDGSERVAEKLADGSIVSQSITNGFGQEVISVSAATGNRYIYTRSEYNAKGQITKQYQDTGLDTTSTAPTLFEYDLFGNLSKKILKLSDEADSTNSPVLEISIGLESDEDGVYERITQNRNSANGNMLTYTEKNLISNLSETVKNIQVTIDERGKTSVKKTSYLANGKLCVEETIPTSNITSVTIYIDDFAISHRDHTGLTSTYSRAYSSAGFHITKVDSRGNNYIEYYDIHERIVQTTDGANNSTYTEYDERFDSPCLIREEDGSTIYYKYDERERLVAEWGTATQPATYVYDDDDRLISAISYREEDDLIVGNPENIESNDITSWEYDNVTGLETKKIYADGSFSSKSYDSFNRLASETNARGITKYYEYEHARGLLTDITYSNNENNVSFSYDILGQLITINDGLGERTIGYNDFSEQVSDVFISGTTTHEICEKIDNFGRNSGYTYLKNNSVQQNITLAYGASGLLATVSFTHAGNEKTFSYEYLQNSNLIQMITYPNNMKLMNEYEANRDLLINMTYKRGETRVTERTYVHDNMERPISCTLSRLGRTHQDSFIYNNRSEMIEAYMHGDNYSYSFDNAGNRVSYQKNSENAVDYTTNYLNQYTSIGNYSPMFDQDGNQTSVKTSTGEWSITYNADGRPVLFVNSERDLTIECGYDFLGRRLYKKVTQNDEIISQLRYIYRGFLQIAACDMKRNNEPCLWLINWDPSQSVATRPLSIQKDSTWYTYGVDLSKNVTEVYGPNGYIRTSYSYSPSGECVSDGDVSQPIQWSSEHVDEETGLVYYNFRYYNPLDGRWISRDDIDETGNIYCYTNNNFFYMDILGLSKYHWHHLIPNVFFKKKFRECLAELSGEAIFNGIFLTEEQHRRIHRKINNGGDWNNKIEKKLKNLKCCKREVLEALVDELRKEVKDEYGGIDVDIDKDEWDRKSSKDKDKHTDDLEKKEKENKKKKKKKNKKKNNNPKKKPTPKRAASRAASKALAKAGAKMAVKFALKKVPVIGWGFAAYGAYQGYRSGGIRGAIIGALF